MSAAQTHADTHTHTHTHIHTHKHTKTHTHTHTHTQTHTHTHVRHTNIHSHTHTCDTHTHTQTQTHTLSLSHTHKMKESSRMLQSDGTFVNSERRRLSDSRSPASTSGRSRLGPPRIMQRVRPSITQKHSHLCCSNARALSHAVACSYSRATTRRPSKL